MSISEQLFQDYRKNDRQWRSLSMEDYWEYLGSVPPMRHSSTGFVMGEEMNLDAKRRQVIYLIFRCSPHEHASDATASCILGTLQEWADKIIEKDQVPKLID